MAAGQTASAGASATGMSGMTRARAAKVVGDVLVVAQLAMIGACLVLGLAPASVQLGRVLEWAVHPALGLLLIAGAAVVGGLGVLGLRSDLRIHPVPGPAVTLHTEGIYRWVRHPMYLAVFLGCLGAALVHGRLLALLAVLLLAGVLLVKGRFEDKMLQERFGWQYAVYIQRTPAVVPMPWRTLRR